MDKRELVTLAARRSTLTQRQVDEALHAILETMAEAIAAGEHEVDEVQLTFKASAVLRRRLKKKST